MLRERTLLTQQIEQLIGSLEVSPSQILGRICQFNPDLCVLNSVIMTLYEMSEPACFIRELVSPEQWCHQSGLINRFLTVPNNKRPANQELELLLTAEITPQVFISRINKTGLFEKNFDLDPWEAMKQYQEFKSRKNEE